MLRTVIVGMTALFIAGPTVAYSQTESHGQEMLKSVDWKAMTDARIDLIKAALQLTPDQEKLWPPVEEAIRARSEARLARMEEMAKPRTERRDALELLQARAANLTARGEGLKKLADAWQPLYEKLDDKQKQRLRVLAVYALREMRDVAESRQMMHMDMMHMDDESGDE